LPAGWPARLSRLLSEAWWSVKFNSPIFSCKPERAMEHSSPRRRKPRAGAGHRECESRASRFGVGERARCG